MAQYRQYGVGNGSRNGVASDHVSIGVRGGSRHLHHRRSKAPTAYRISIGLCVVTLLFVLCVSAFCYFVLQRKGVEISRDQAPDDDTSINTDFLMNVTQINKSKDLKFGLGSVAEERDNKSSFSNTYGALDHSGNSSYYEAGRNELKQHEAEYESSLKNTADSESTDVLDDDDEYDDGMDIQDGQMEEYDVGHDEKDYSALTIDTWESSHALNASSMTQDAIEEGDKASNDLHDSQNSEAQHRSGHANSAKGQPGRKLIPGKRSRYKKKPKGRKPSGKCDMKIMDSTALLVEPIESPKFARFSLQYTEKEEKEIDDENWEPRFAGHQSLREREKSFVARDQKINCGFVKGPEGSPSTGFDLAEDDAKYISSCHVAVSSCIFGNSDRLRSPMGKTVSRLSKKNVCFVMFVDEVTLQTLSSEGQMPDMMGFIGLWKIVVVKNLPYTDMRRVGKIPKLIPHRLFPSARYSIWLDSKLRLQLDPLLILEYFLWRKGYEYAISNHYDRHCLWQEVAQNKKLNKYNHSVIDEQFAFYQADGMRKFNASDRNKLLPSNVPEGSFIIRAHTPMSNLFSCLWFNEVDRFTPRDQLSFAYTYHKLTRMNPGKPFYLNMFKDCERRKIAKLFRHRSEEMRNSPQL